MTRKYDLGEDTAHRDCPICPHCGNFHRDAWEWDFGPGLEGEKEKECDACGGPMVVTRHATITYSTVLGKAKS